MVWHTLTYNIQPSAKAKVNLSYVDPVLLEPATHDYHKEINAAVTFLETQPKSTPGDLLKEVISNEEVLLKQRPFQRGGLS